MMTDAGIELDRIIRDVVSGVSRRAGTPPGTQSSPAGAIAGRVPTHRSTEQARSCPGIARACDCAGGSAAGCHCGNGCPLVGVLRLDCHVVTRAEIDGRLAGIREAVVLATAVVTPLARDYLREHGVALRRAETQAITSSAQAWVAVVEPSLPNATSLAAALAQAGLRASDDRSASADDFVQGLIEVASLIQERRIPGAMVVCRRPALAACLANKVGDVRAAAVGSTAQASEVIGELHPTILVVPAGVPIHELRGIARAAVGCTGGGA